VHCFSLLKWFCGAAFIFFVHDSEKCDALWHCKVACNGAINIDRLAWHLVKHDMFIIWWWLGDLRDGAREDAQQHLGRVICVIIDVLIYHTKLYS
jgi:hypothetical protein